MSIASRTGVADTSNLAASAGTETSSPAARPPETIAAATESSIVARRLDCCAAGLKSNASIMDTPFIELTVVGKRKHTSAVFVTHTQ
ncbi:hypothetical protein ACFPRL_24565 [Pseudoclavibacter helvolus]